MNLKELSEELSSYISDAEKLERVIEAFREMDQWLPLDPQFSTAYLKLKALIDDE